MSKYISTFGLTNDAGIGIIKIKFDNNEYRILWDLVCDNNILRSGISSVKIDEAEEMYFDAIGMEIPLGECIVSF